MFGNLWEGCQKKLGRQAKILNSIWLHTPWHVCLSADYFLAMVNGEALYVHTSEMIAG